MNSPANSTATARRALIDRRFPGGIPRLWCPLITHYDGDGHIDGARMAAHLKHLSPHVKGFLIPGSTGDGWEMNDAEIQRVLDLALDQAARLDFQVLIGVLKTAAAEARRTILGTTSRLRSLTGAGDDVAALTQARVAGFTVCPPRGRDLTQEQISAGLESVLQTGLPVSLYQLPQVTENTMTPGLVAALAARFSNFILFKDTSGADAVALSGESLAGVFMVRGAEGDYARWLKETGGPYDGFLLSTANCFGRELHQIIRDLELGRREAAVARSQRLTAAVKNAFDAVQAVPQGNPFANANKAMDHFFAHGPNAEQAPSPRLHAGVRLPMEVVRNIGEILVRHRLMPERGYLE